jgi:hypothetical protein
MVPHSQANQLRQRIGEHSFAGLGMIENHLPLLGVEWVRLGEFIKRFPQRSTAS